MKKLLLAVALMVPVIGLSAGDWQLVWSEEFNYQGLPDPAKWKYEEGFVRNQESQYYTQERLENARVENGSLIIECRREHWPLPENKSAEYTSASLTSKTNWLYGRFEMRARLPAGKGIWPAFWTKGTNDVRVGWPHCGEIDIMEFVGKSPGRIYSTVHYPVDGHPRKDARELKTAAPLDQFHIYAAEWFPDRIDFYFDNHKYHTFLIDQAGKGPGNPFRKPHYVLLNLALDGSWGGPIDDGALPQRYIVDYIRVYQQKEPPEKRATGF